MPLAMNREVFITCAVTGSGGTQDRSPHVPRSPKQIADSAIAAAKAGAGVWGAAKTVFPDGVWVLVTSKDEQEAARSAAKAAGVAIVGWAVPAAEALAAVRG